MVSQGQNAFGCICVTFLHRYLGNIENPSYMPELQLPFVEPLTFGQRLANTISYAMQVEYMWELGHLEVALCQLLEPRIRLLLLLLVTIHYPPANTLSHHSCVGLGTKNKVKQARRTASGS